MTVPQYDQDSFRGRNDDGNETGASWKTGSPNQNWTQAVDENFRVRFLVQNTNSKVGYNQSFRVQCNYNGGGWFDVTAESSILRASASDYLTDGADTTQQLGSGAFITDNNGVEDGDGYTTACPTFTAGGEWEGEYCLQIIGADVEHNYTFQLQLELNDNTLLDYYTNTPTITVNKPVVLFPPIPGETHRRRRRQLIKM